MKEIPRPNLTDALVPVPETALWLPAYVLQRLSLAMNLKGLLLPVDDAHDGGLPSDGVDVPYVCVRPPPDRLISRDGVDDGVVVRGV